MNTGDAAKEPNTAKITSRGRKTTLKQSIENTVRQDNSTTNQPQTESALVIPEKTKSDSPETGIQLYRKKLPNNRPIGTDTFEISRYIHQSGTRPIGVGHLEISGTLDRMGLRPVEMSHQQVVHAPNGRPVMSSTIQVHEMFKSSGERPIEGSHLLISQLYAVMGNRPIASNDIDDPKALMGFID